VEKEMKMADMMQKLNRVIHRSTLSARFISLFYGEIESTGNILRQCRTSAAVWCMDQGHASQGDR
jgi:serine phosphatase RsbU (regulator of sigma subunit)